MFFSTMANVEEERKLKNYFYSIESEVCVEETNSKMITKREI